MIPLLAAASILAAVPFDLACTGAVTTRSAARPPVAASGPFTMRLRIDPPSRRACVDSCRTPYPLGSFTAENIIFHISDPATGKQSDIFVERAAGQLEVHTLGANGARADARAVCRPAPFSGFPTQKPR